MISTLNVIKQMKINQPKSVTGRKLRSGVTWRGALELKP
jgi:hypothetical protein